MYAARPTPAPAPAYGAIMGRPLLAHHATRRRATLPALYAALSEISAMRDSVAELVDDMPRSDAERLLAKIGQVETVALHLLAVAETAARVVAH